MRVAIALAVAMAIGSITIADAAQATIRKHTNIQAQDLDAALQRLAKDRNIQLVYASAEVNSLKSGSAVGELTTEETTAQLLNGTGLTYFFLDANTITVAPMSRARMHDEGGGGGGPEHYCGGARRSDRHGAETAGGLDRRLAFSAAARAAADGAGVLLCHGGPIATPQDAAYVLSRCDAVEFVGASSMERLPVETAITETTRAFKSIQVRATRGR